MVVKMGEKSNILGKLNQCLDYKMGQSITLTEKYDIVNMAKLLSSSILDDEYRGSILKYRAKSKFGKVKVKYTRNKIGRLTIKADNLKDEETLTTQSCMWKEAKSILCKNIYYDLDVVNSHPVMLYYIFSEQGYEIPTISYYVKNRDKLIEKLSNENNLNRDMVKELIISIFYGGAVDSFKKKYNIETLPLIFNQLEKELKENRKRLLDLEENAIYRNKAIEEKGYDYYNIDGTALSYLLQTHECNVLMIMYKYITTRKNGEDSIGALIHDGLHIEIGFIDGYGRDKLIKELEKEIETKTKFKLKLKIKPFDSYDEIDNIITVETDKEGGDYVTEKLKNDYIICQERIFMRINNVWTNNDKNIKRQLTKEIGNFNIQLKSEKKDKEGDTIIEIKPHSKMNKGCKDIMTFVEPTEDEDFIERLWTSNLCKLCFKNGYWSFKENKLKPYDLETDTTIKINRNYNKASEELKKEVMDRIFNPIFNNDIEMMECWMNYIVRGLAGHVEDKNWAVAIGERDCGKGVLVGLLENSFGEYCRSTNSENFLYKNAGQDSAKALSWLVPFEFKRLLLTNEITKDAEGKFKINGNILKKLSSGGDKIEARVNHKDEINFKIQSRVCIFCNDLPPIEPSDAKETAYMFKCPSKFVEEGDKRLKEPVMRKKYHINDKDEIIYEKDEEGKHIMVNICNFYKKDDDIKAWTKKPEVIDAFIDILFSRYGPKVAIPQNMKEEQEDFKEEETDENKFYELFNFSDDEAWNGDWKDWLSIETINMFLKKANINASSQKYKGWMHKRGCVKAKRTNEKDGKRVNAWINIQINKGKKAEILDGQCLIGDESDEDDEY